jgi:hypothetical protein
MRAEAQIGEMMEIQQEKVGFRDGDEAVRIARGH